MKRVRLNGASSRLNYRRCSNTTMKHAERCRCRCSIRWTGVYSPISHPLLDDLNLNARQPRPLHNSRSIM